MPEKETPEGSGDAETPKNVDKAQYREMTFRAFLEQSPPDRYIRIIDFEGINNNPHYLRLPDILLFCEDQDCQGMRMFRCKENTIFS